MNNTWEGDWKTRIRERVKEKGYQDLIDFSEKNPSLSFFELTKLLGENIAPIQTEQMLSEEYYQKGQYTRYLKSSLARELKNARIDGWQTDEAFNISLFSSIQNWKNHSPDEYAYFTDKVLNILQHSDFIPNDWLPSGADDPIVLKIFEEAGFKEVEIVR